MVMLDDFYLDPNQMKKRNKSKMSINGSKKMVNSKVIDVNKSLLN
jgi:hypothetical protein